MANRRVVVTGIGVKCPLGSNPDELSDNINQGKCSIRDISGEYAFLQDYKVKIGSVYSPSNFKYSRRVSRFSQFALDASTMAITDAGLLELISGQEQSSEQLRRRTGVLIGVGMGGLIEIEQQKANLITGDRFNKMFMLSVIPDAAPGTVANAYHLHATDCPAIGTACASGASSIMYGAMHIKEDIADIAVCGGTVEAGTELTIKGFGGLDALSTKRNHEPEKASRPFDKDRDGFVVGEGAGIVILEELEHARARGARIYAELLGFGCSTDGEHFTEPSLEYQVMAIEMALERSGLKPEQIDYINCHGTSTFLNDKTETQAVKRVFGNHAYKIPCSSVKGAIGHTTSASGGIETVVLLKAMEKQIIPPTLNLEAPDIENGCDLDYVPFEQGQLRKAEINYALKNSFGFYGHNTVLVFGKLKE